MTTTVLRRPSKGLFKQHGGSTHDLEYWHKVFIEMADVTCYAPAIELAGTWEEWNRIVNDWPEFKDKILQSWLEEVEVKLRSMAISNLAAEVVANGKGAVAAAKWIAEGRYSPRQAGRPTKAHIEKQARIQAKTSDEVEDDVARVMEAMEQKEGAKIN